jgi:hypothetical protein
MSCTAADLINIQPLTLSDTFNTWFDRTNEVIAAANNVNIYDIGVGATGGLFMESGCSGGFYNGLALMSVDVGAGLGIGSGAFTNNTNKVVVDALLLEDLGTGASSNPATDDYIIVADMSDGRQGVAGTPKRTSAARMLPPIVTFGDSGNGSFTIQGDVNIVGNLNVSDSVSYIDSNDLRIEDKVIELALNRYVQFVVQGTGLTAETFAGGQTAYYIDSGTPTPSTATSIGTVRSWSLGSGSSTTGTIQVHNFSEGGVSDFVLGGTLVVTGAAYLSTLMVTSQPSISTDYFNDELLTPAGVEIKGASGDKTFLWNYRTPDLSETWNAFMVNTNLGVTGAANSVISSRFSSYGYDSATNNTFTFEGQGSSYSKVAVGTELSMEHSPAGAAGTTFGIVAIGSTGTTYPNSTVYAWVKRFNADQLDGAHASTAATAWTIPVSLTDGRVHENFIRADGVRKVFSTPNSGFAVGDVVRIDSSGGLTFAKANTIPTAEVFGMVETVHGDRISVVTEGYITGLTGARINAVTPLVTGSVYYLSAAVAGGLIANPDEGAYALTLGQVRRAVLLATDGDKGYVTAYAGTVLGEGVQTDLVYLSTVAPVGSISPYTGNHDRIPDGWLLCDGKALRPNDYADLYDIIEQKYHASAVVGGDLFSVIMDGDTRNLVVGDGIVITFTDGGFVQTYITAIDTSTRVVTIADAMSGHATNEILKVYGSGDSTYTQVFFLPDLRTRTILGTSFGDGLSGSGVIDPELALGNMGGNAYVPDHQHSLATAVQTGSGAFGASTVQTGNPTVQVSNLPPYISAHWIIRSKKSLPAIILTGHNHDNFYIRYDIPHTVGAGAGNTLSEANRTLFRSNAKVLRNDADDTFRGDLSITGHAIIDGNTRIAGNLAVTGQSWCYTKTTVVGAADILASGNGSMPKWDDFIPNSNLVYNGYNLGKVQVMSHEPYITLFDINRRGDYTEQMISQGRIDFFGNMGTSFGWNNESNSPTGSYYTGALVMTLAQQGATAFNSSDNLGGTNINSSRKEVRIGFNLAGVTSSGGGDRSDETVFEMSRHIINTNFTASGNLRPRVKFPRGLAGATSGEPFDQVVINRSTGELKSTVGVGISIKFIDPVNVILGSNDPLYSNIWGLINLATSLYAEIPSTAQVLLVETTMWAGNTPQGSAALYSTHRTDYDTANGGTGIKPSDCMVLATNRASGDADQVGNSTQCMVPILRVGNNRYFAYRFDRSISSVPSGGGFLPAGTLLQNDNSHYWVRFIGYM